MVGIEQIITQLLNGFVYGSILALIAIGLTIIFGLMGIVNFAHGGFYALGAFAGYAILQFAGPYGFLVAIVAVPIIIGVVGVAIERTVIQPLYGRPILYSLLLTFGLLLVIEEAIAIIWGRGAGRSFSIPDFLEFSVPLVIVDYPSYRLFVVGVAAITMIALWLFLQKTLVGVIVRAAAENMDMVRSLGINVERVYTIVFAIGVGVAALAGVVHAPITSIFPEMGSRIIIESFVVVVIGGLNSFKGSIIAGILVGVTSTMTFLVWPAATDAVIFLLMIIVLLIRPQGLMGLAGGGVE